MSIINQTLRELDARKSPARAWPVASASVAVARPRRRRLVVGVVTLFPVVAMLGWLGLAERDVPETAPDRVASRRAEQRAERPAAPRLALPVAIQRGAPAAAAEPPTHADAVAVPDIEAERDTEQALRVSAPASSAPLQHTARSSGPGHDALVRRDLSGPGPDEEAEARYRKALTLARSGRENQARALLDEAIRLAPGFVAARQLLATLLDEAGRNAEAEAVLSAGYRASPDNAWFALSLARLQAGRGHLEAAAATLLEGMDRRAVDAEYRATLAALLLRLDRHPEAAQQYEHALRIESDRGQWWMGLGLALEGEGKAAAARTAFARALATNTLPEKLAEFVQSKLENQ